MRNAILRAIAAKASEASAKAVAAPVKPVAAAPAPAIRKWSDRDFAIPAIPAKPKAEVRESIHYRIVKRTK